MFEILTSEGEKYDFTAPHVSQIIYWKKTIKRINA
jgi:hypothetical protein